MQSLFMTFLVRLLVPTQSFPDTMEKNIAQEKGNIMAKLGTVICNNSNAGNYFQIISWLVILKTKNAVFTPWLRQRKKKLNLKISVQEIEILLSAVFGI